MAAALASALTVRSVIAAAARPRKQVLAFYYGWYGTKAVSGQDIHWSNPDPVARTIADSPDYPVASPYDSLSPQVIDRHVADAKAAGLTGFIASWWGRSDRTDRQFNPLLDTCAKAGLKTSLYIEKADSADNLIGDLEYLYRRYGKHRAFLRHHGRPVIFVFDRVLQTLGLSGWLAVRQRLEARIGRKLFLVGTGNSIDEVHERSGAFDALHIYSQQFALGKSPAFDGASPKDYYTAWVAGQKSMAVTTATVLPGFDDSHLPDRVSPQTVRRHEGKLFETLWQAAMSAGPDWVLIVSYNEWHEASQIEPSDRHGRREIDTNARMSAAFLKGQPPEDDEEIDDKLNVSGDIQWPW